MNQQIIERLKQLRLYGMLGAYQQVIDNPGEHYTGDELIEHLLDWEWTDRNNRAVHRLVKMARFRYNASLEELDYHPERGLDRTIVQRLSTGHYIAQAQNVLISGSTGTGKSYLATALGSYACEQRNRVYYTNTVRLFTRLKMAKSDGTLLKELAKLEKTQLLILDDFGLQPLDTQARSLLMDIMEDRHGRASTMIVGQIPLENWHNVIGDPTTADALLDRWVHGSYRIDLQGESLRRKAAQSRLKQLQKTVD